MPMTEGTVPFRGYFTCDQMVGPHPAPGGKAPLIVVRGGRAGAEWVVFEDSAHLAKVEEPDRYREALDTFLSRMEPRS
ncbi:hypothetical protein [Streptomyces sp. NBC_01481]|uniref:hypothetical protein n=1 Tax=Streptomyces sp. NBC_01481 TaxID=2975869 RepID=UPI002256A4E6|nr:hypothetical protein [Streptomyces sp. NBC_01481]MCX4584563.1 hypothetical protein [Streptomyces sp. NBC_01481]